MTATIGQMGILSFNCHKTIQCGEGGAVLTNDDTLADRLKLMRNHGEVVLSQREEVPPELAGHARGYNYRLTELQSAVALGQVRRLEELTVPRIEMANAITAGLAGVPGITPPHVAKGDRHVYYIYAMKVDAAKVGLSRNQLRTALDAGGRRRRPAGYVRPIYLYPMYEERVAKQKTGFGAGVSAPEPGRQTYARGLCPVTERMHFEELLTTNIIRADLGREDAMQLVTAIRRSSSMPRFGTRSPRRESPDGRSAHRAAGGARRLPADRALAGELPRGRLARARRAPAVPQISRSTRGPSGAARAGRRLLRGGDLGRAPSRVPRSGG